MLPKQRLQDWFHFTRKDRIFTFIVVLIVAGSLLLPRLFAPAPSPLPMLQNSALVLAMDTLQERQARKPSYQRNDNATSYQYERSAVKPYTEGELFPFDPNTISLSDWQRLGLNERTSKTILNYISKGGRFYQPEDLQKIWGMPEGFYQRVKDYVRLAAVPKKTFPAYREERSNFAREERKPVTVDVNAADTSAFIALPGIGSKLSARIVSFREKLGGFYSVEQIGETYGLPDSTFQKIKTRLAVDGAAIRKLNVNTATKDELKTHPYIRWNLANAIVEYRNQHGPYTSMEDLKKIVLIDEATFQKLVHYLHL